MSTFEHVLVERDGAILWITINRPQALNALNPLAHRELSLALDSFADDAALRVAVITGAGERAFCVGSDLKARATINADDHPPTGFGGISHRFDLAKPVIAADHVEFGLPEPRVGLAALGGGGLQRLARHLPLKYAMELVLTGRRNGVAETVRFGIAVEQDRGAVVLELGHPRIERYGDGTHSYPRVLVGTCELLRRRQDDRLAIGRQALG